MGLVNYMEIELALIDSIIKTKSDDKTRVLKNDLVD